jgi:hypothetical protein
MFHEELSSYYIFPFDPNADFHHHRKVANEHQREVRIEDVVDPWLQQQKEQQQLP